MSSIHVVEHSNMAEAPKPTMKCLKTAKPTHMEWGIIIWISICIGFLVALYTPLEIFFYNQSEFWFDFSVLFPVLISSFIMISIVNILLLLFCRLIGVIIFRVAASVEFVCYVCIYIQGNYLIKNLPALNGAVPDWSIYGQEHLITALLWLMVTGVVVFLVIKFGLSTTISIGRWIMVGITATLVITLVTVCITTNGLNKKLDAMVTDKGLMTMSEEKNFIILMLDALDSSTFSEVLSEDKELQTALRDFTYYPNTLGAYPLTSRSVPFIISGEWFENAEPFLDYCERAYRESPLLKEVSNRNYSIELYESSIPVQDPFIFDYENVIDGNQLKSSFALAQLELKLTLFKSLPYALKPLFMPDMGAFAALQSVSSGYDTFAWDDVLFYNRLQESSIALTQKPCFKWIHLEGAHQPWNLNANLNYIENGTYKEKVVASTKIVKAYLQKLEEAKVFDDSVVIIMADHGALEYNQNPLLLVKGVQESGEATVRISNAPISYDDLQAAYMGLLDGKNSREVFAAKEGDVRTRRFLYFDYLKEDLMTEYYQTGLAKDANTMQKSTLDFSTKDSNDHQEYSGDIYALKRNEGIPWIHIDQVDDAGDGMITVYGWAMDARGEKPALTVLESNGKYYCGVSVYREDVKALRADWAESGFRITLPKADMITAHIIAGADETLCEPLFLKQKRNPSTNAVQYIQLNESSEYDGDIRAFQLNGGNPEIHIDWVHDAGSEMITVYGWAMDARGEKPALTVLESNGRYYRGVPVYREDVKVLRADWAESGFRITLPKTDAITAYIIAGADDTLCNPLTITLPEPA